MTRAESKERTRQRLLTQAQRLFRERGYAATSLEQIAEAAEVTKGAIYGHFASKEDLMLTAMEAAPAPDYATTLGDESRPLRERVAEFSRAVSAEQPGDEAELAVMLEFWAALLRSPDALHRYSARVEGRLRALADPGPDAGTSSTPTLSRPATVLRIASRWRVYSTAASPVSATMRRTPEAMLLSEMIRNRLMSPVAATCVPPSARAPP